MLKHVLIVEDESWAWESLSEMLDTLLPSAMDIVIKSTVREAKAWLAKNEVDLIFMDIHLGDGLSFDIFEEVKVKAPVIFTTAYENYALEAFKHQGYAYILKPYEIEELEAALKKVAPLFESSNVNNVVRSYKERFLVRYGLHLKSIAVQDIAYFMAEDKVLYANTYAGDRYILEDTITGLTSKLNPSYFYQVNRKFIVHIDAINSMLKVGRNRIRLQLTPTLPDGIEVFVSEEKSIDFQTWLDS